MKFSDLTECPFCGSGEFFTPQYVYGTIRYNERFDGKETDNDELYDGLNTKKYSGKAYCKECRNYLGNRNSDMLSKAAEKAVSISTSSASDA